jgi:hypothetical protein
MLLHIDVGIIICAPIAIHIEFQLLLVRYYYSYQVCQNGSKCLWKICQNSSKCLWIQRQEESVITITLRGIRIFYRRSLHTRITVSKNLDRSAKNCGKENKRPIGRPPPPSKHLRLFWRKKKHKVFFPAAKEENIARVNLFHKPSISFYLMAIIAIVAIHQECIIPVALFNWSIVTY